MKRIVIYIVVFILLSTLTIYSYLFYPLQSMPVGAPVEVTTIDTAKYHNDCLHPCIRFDARSGKYYMAQSPYYAWCDQVENPMFYISDDYKVWNNGIIIADTPDKGHNSDPNIYLCENGEIIYLWRECGTPLCDSIGCYEASVGGVINQHGTLSEKRVYCINHWLKGDTEQAPVMIEKNGKRYIYAAWYEYEPKRENKGIAI